jgi:DNA primase
MPYKAQGITHIFLLFDGDEAGEKAAKQLKPLIEQEEFVVEIIKLPDGSDPGELDQFEVNSIAEYITK